MTGETFGGGDIDGGLSRSAAGPEERGADRVSRMRAEGREPAPSHDLWGTMCPVFFFALRWPTDGSDAMDIRIGAERPGERDLGFIWGEGWPEHGARLSGGDLLACLARNWLVIARGFLVGGAPEPALGQEVAVTTRDFVTPTGFVVDLGRGLGRPDLPHFAVCVRGAEVGIFTPAQTWTFGPESVIVPETLLALGNLVAERLRSVGLRPEAVAEWERVRAFSDLLPMSLDVVPEGSEPPDDTEAAAAHWSRRLGQDTEAYRRAAVWLSARQWLSAARGGEPPAAAEWDVRSLPSPLPSEAEVAALVAEVVATVLEGTCTAAEFERSSIIDRNDRARQQVLFGAWPERGRPVDSCLGAGDDGPSLRRSAP